MIFNSFALLFGIYKLSKKTNKSASLGFYIKSTLVILFLFYISVSSVNYIRSNYFYVGKSSEFILKELTDKTKPEIKKVFYYFRK